MADFDEDEWLSGLWRTRRPSETSSDRSGDVDSSSWRSAKKLQDGSRSKETAMTDPDHIDQLFAQVDSTEGEAAGTVDDPAFQPFCSGADLAAHFESLDDLKNVVISRCGIHHLRSNEQDASPIGILLRPCVELFGDISKALNFLIFKGFCPGSFNILVQDPDRANVAIVRSVKKSSIDQLLAVLEKLISPAQPTFGDPTHPSKQSIPERNENHEAELLVNNLLDSLGIEHSSPSDVSAVFVRNAPSSAGSRFSSNLGKLCMLLAFGLASYAGSHVGDLYDDSQTGEDSMGDIAFRMSSRWTFRRCELACLARFVGGPAWVVVDNYRHGPPESRIDTSFAVSITLREFSDLWGPIWKVPILNSNGLSHIFTERGMLSSIKATSSPSNVDELEFHWRPARETALLQAYATHCWLAQQPSESVDIDSENGPAHAREAENSCACKADICVGCSDETRLLVGTTHSKSLETFWINPGCRDGFKSLQGYRHLDLEPRYASSNHFELDVLQASLGLGFQVTPGVAALFKAKKGTTYRSALIAGLKCPYTRLEPILRLKIGLEISLCTGNAERISLWDALRLSSLSRYELVTGAPAARATPNGRIVPCSHEIGDVNCLFQCWDNVMCAVFLKPELASVDRRLLSLDRNPRLDAVLGKLDDTTRAKVAEATNILRGIIFLAISDFEPLGIQPDGRLKAWWPFEDNPYTAELPQKSRGEIHNWFHAVRESRFTTIFPVFSTRCLHYASSDHRHGNIPVASGCFRGNGPAVTARVVQFKTGTTVLHTSIYTDEYDTLFNVSDMVQLRGAGILEVANDDPQPLTRLSANLFAHAKAIINGPSKAKELTDASIAPSLVRQVYIM